MGNLDPNFAVAGLIILAIVAMVLGQLKPLTTLLRVVFKQVRGHNPDCQGEEDDIDEPLREEDANY